MADPGRGGQRSRDQLAPFITPEHLQHQLDRLRGGPAPPPAQAPARPRQGPRPPAEQRRGRGQRAGPSVSTDTGDIPTGPYPREPMAGRQGTGPTAPASAPAPAPARPRREPSAEAGRRRGQRAGPSVSADTGDILAGTYPREPLAGRLGTGPTALSPRPAAQPPATPGGASKAHSAPIGPSPKMKLSDKSQSFPLRLGSRKPESQSGSSREGSSRPLSRKSGGGSSGGIGSGASGSGDDDSLSLAPPRHLFQPRG